MTVTRKLPKSVNLTTVLRDAGGQIRGRIAQSGGVIWISGGFVLLLALLVTLAAVSPRGKENSAAMGRWAPLLNEEDADFAIAVDRDTDTGAISLRIKTDELNEAVPNSDHRKWIKGHVTRFNNAVTGRRYFSALVPKDCLFWVENDQTPRLRVRDLSAFNTFPKQVRTLEPLGGIHLRPTNTPVPFLSDGYLSLFPQPGDQSERFVDLTRPGLFSAGVLTLTDADGGAKATIQANMDGAAVTARPRGGTRLFIENNAPETQADLQLNPGDIVEIAGRFFETRVENGGIVATSTIRGNSEKRLYPMGGGLHFVGPVSLTGAHQSLGMEYMFREYLQGDLEQNMPPGRIWLTIDPGLQGELAANVQDLAAFSKVRKASGMIMNAKTGAILALSAQPIPYDPGDTDGVLKMLDAGADKYANHGGFKRHVIGSVTKPFFAFLALHLMPEVTDMRVQVQGSGSPTLFGHNLYGRRRDTPRQFAFKRNEVDFSTYLVQSDNAFQHSLGMLMLAGVTDLNQIPQPWLVRDKKGRPILRPTRPGDDYLSVATLGAQGRNHLTVDSAANPYTAALRDIFDIQTEPGEGRVHDRNLELYGPLVQQAADTLTRLNPTLANPHKVLRRRSTICAPESPRLEMDAVKNTMDASNLLFGANRNHWTDVKACEAFSRMITGNRVEARIVAQYLDTLNPDEKGAPETVNLEKEATTLILGDGSQIDPTVYQRLRRDLERVSTVGTAKRLAPAIRAIKAQPGLENFRLFGKTGTIDDGKPDSKLFLGTFGLWNKSEQSFDGTACTFIFYLKNALDEDAVLKTIEKALPRWLKRLHKLEAEAVTADPEPTVDQSNTL